MHMNSLQNKQINGKLKTHQKKNISVGHFIIQNIFAFHCKHSHKFIYLPFSTQKSVVFVAVYLLWREEFPLALCLGVSLSLCVSAASLVLATESHSIKTGFFLRCQLVHVYAAGQVCEYAFLFVACTILYCDKLHRHTVKKCRQQKTKKSEEKREKRVNLFIWCIIYNYESRSKQRAHTCKHRRLNHRSFAATHTGRVNNNRNIFLLYLRADSFFLLIFAAAPQCDSDSTIFALVVCVCEYWVCLRFCSRSVAPLHAIQPDSWFCIFKFKLIINKYVRFMQKCVHIIALRPFL